MNRSTGLIVLVASVVAISEAAVAQTFPARPLRMIVPFPPGGSIDPIVRRVGEEMAKSLGQSVIIENKPGGSSVIGIDAAAKSRADGYTLVTVANSFAVNHTLVPKLPYDTFRDLRPIGLMTRTPNVLVGHPRVPARDLHDVIAFAKANPGKLSYGSPGSGTVQHLFGESLKAAAKVDILHVPYKGAAINDLLSGEIDLFVGNLPTWLPYIRAGKLRSFGVTSSTRVQAAPELATIAEQGYPGIDTSAWFGLMAPAAVSDQIAMRLNEELVRALSSSEIRRAFVAQGIEPLPGTPEEFGAFLRSEVAKYARVIKEASIKLD